MNVPISQLAAVATRKAIRLMISDLVERDNAGEITGLKSDSMSRLDLNENHIADLITYDSQLKKQIKNDSKKMDHTRRC